MEDSGYWVTPLLLLPGVALLIMSTSIRYNRLHDETHELAHGQDLPAPDVVSRLERRGRMLRDALVSFYLAVGLLSLASLAGGVGLFLEREVRWLSYGTTGVAVTTVLYGAGLLSAEAFLSLDVIRDHLERVRARDGPSAVRRRQDA